jgi:hypothetical protein
MYYKVRIKKLPNKAMGGTKTGQQTADGALSIQPTAMGGADIDQYIGEKETEVKATLQPVSREEANVEVEKGEIVAGDLNGDGMLETYVAGGKRHSQGGTPLNLPDDTFIFSDTKSMRIKDKDVLQKFGKSSGSYTPADLAKQYDVNKYRKILQDPNSDAIDRKTAELMIRNYSVKLGALALAQESKKGFPQGVPLIAQPFLEANGIQEEQILPTYKPQFVAEEQESQAEPQEEVAYDESMPTQMPNGSPIAMTPEMMQQAPMAAYGMEMGGFSMPYTPDYAYGGFLRRAAEGEEMEPVEPLEGVDPYEQAKTKQGNVTPTGKSNRWSARDENLNQFLTKWEKYIPGIKDMEEAQAQAAIYDWTLKNDPEQIKTMWKETGITNEGKKYKDLVGLTDYDPKEKKYKGTFYNRDLSAEELKALRKAYVDGKFGVRQLNPNEPKPEAKKEEPKKDQVTTQDEYVEETERPDLVNIDQPEAPTVTYPQWMTPDVMNMYGTLADRASIKKYYPWAAPVDLEEARPVYLDPTRDLAANSEQANIAMQNLAQFTGPQTASARAAMVQGQGARQASDILSRYNNANVSIANQFEQSNTNLRNQERLQNQAIAKTLFDQTTLTNQAYDNARRQANQASRLAFQTGWKNAADLALVNATSPQYDIDPRTGTVVFQGGKDLQPDRSKNFRQTVLEYRRLGFDPAEAVQAAKIEFTQGSPYGGLDALVESKKGGMIVTGPLLYPFVL